MIKLLVHVPIFNCSVFFVGDCNGIDAEVAIYKLRNKKTQISMNYQASGGVRDNGSDVFMWVKDLNMASVMAHELAHVACSIMELCNIPQCRETEEVMCYLIGWLKINIQDAVYTKFEKTTKTP